jgi:hypothetical protein
VTGQAVLERNETRIEAPPSRYPAKYRGSWFTKIGDGDMKETNLNIFYQFGVSLSQMDSQIKYGMQLSEFFPWLILAQDWLKAFLAQTEDFRTTLEDSRASVQSIIHTTQGIYASARTNWNRALTHEEVSAVLGARDIFEKNFERECRNLSVFTVTPKGLYDTRLLIDKPEQAFPEKIRRFLPQQMLNDFKQAARCLAFEIPTACAFHVCRGTETLIIQYHEKLSGHPWAEKRRDWGIYIDHLIRDGAPEKITTRLREIAKMERNAYIHPDINVAPEEAPALFSLCAGVIFNMGQELERLTT